MSDSEMVTLSFRVPPKVKDDLEAAAKERMVSVQLLATRAIEQFLERLIPVDELKLTRDDS